MRLQTFMVKNKDSSAGKEKEPLVDNMSSKEETVNPELRTTEEEKCSTIPGSVQATAMALMCSGHAQVNPTVERGMLIKRHKKKNKNPQSKATQMRNQQQ